MPIDYLRFAKAAHDAACVTRVNEALNLVYHGCKESEKPVLFQEVRQWLCEMEPAVAPATKGHDYAVTASTQCSNCRGGIADGWSYCHRCGASRDSAAVDTQELSEYVLAFCPEKGRGNAILSVQGELTLLGNHLVQGLEQRITTHAHQRYVEGLRMAVQAVENNVAVMDTSTVPARPCGPQEVKDATVAAILALEKTNVAE